MGLDILLSVGEQTREQEYKGWEKARSLFIRAVDEDTRGNYLEAYHWYRRVIECSEAFPDNKRLRPLISQAFNNAAVIDCEFGNVEKAEEFLHQAVNIQPDNETARENLTLLKGDI
jgi:tetratricopeptide (TPR) repeat protein